jgi:hypothetical protein
MGIGEPFPSDLGVTSSEEYLRKTELSRQQGLKELQREVERLKLIVEVLVRALVEKGLYTREQLNALANLVDMEDGLRDGKKSETKEVRRCSSCGRVMMNVSGACLYCGHQEVMELI